MRKKIIALIIGLAAMAGATTVMAQRAVENFIWGQERYRAFYNSLSPEQQEIESYMDQVFTTYRQQTGQVLAPTEENATAIMRQGNIPRQYRSFVMSRMGAHAKNQEAHQVLEKAQQDPNCWYLPENAKRQFGCK
jgi:hypothetical protein